jgi:peptidoglycan/LPS O-acetylase OafA/YrhL
MNFRLDINGLRFLAVTMVVLFHFKFSYFYGGYAGVDVFFVISGFLMQEICNKEMKSANWVLKFYKKRFNRIYPALLIMTILTFIVAIYSETPNGVNEAFRQTLSALSFTSNIYYLVQSGGYFSTTSDFNWLLHTWSLSLEWQYYLIFPMIIYIGSFIERYKSHFYLSLILISFSLCIIFGKDHLSANFYLLPTRMWELLIGAFASILTIKNSRPKTTEIIAVLVLILFTVFVKDSGLWPGLATLIPTIATASIIHANLNNTDTLFKSKTIQSVGSASYSIYLFHWPVVSFMANNSIDFNIVNSSIGVVISLSLGFLSYKYFEKLFNVSYVRLGVITLTFVTISSVAAKIEISKLWVSDQTIALDKYKNYADSDEGIKQFGNSDKICFLTSTTDNISFYNKNACLRLSKKKKNILLIGDSHAAELSQSMRDIFKEYNVMQATASGCLPVRNYKGEKRCTDLFNFIYNDYLKNNKVDYIFISANWLSSNDKQMYEKLASTINSLNTKNIYIIGQTKTFSIDFYKIAQKTDGNKIEALVLPLSRSENTALSEFLKNKNIRYIDIFNINCSDSTCEYLNKDNIPMMFDKNHLTKAWADHYVKYVKSRVNL